MLGSCLSMLFYLLDFRGLSNLLIAF